MSKISQGALDNIRNLSIFENAFNVYYLWEYKRMKSCFVQKWKYVHNRDEFIRKFKIKYPQITVEEISNFIRIYLPYELAENNYEKSDLFFDNQILLFRLCWVGSYLQEGDYKYCWLNKYNGDGVHFP